MALVQIVNIVIHQPEDKFINDIGIEITFDVLKKLEGSKC